MIEFNIPTLTGLEQDHILDALKRPDLSGAQYYSKKCEHWIESKFSVKRAYLVPSGTHALEMAALLLNIQPGDEVIMPSFTFPTTASAFVLRGASLVFVDIDPVSMNITADNIEAAITPKTKCIVPVHYAGVSCEMDAIVALAKANDIYIVEDAAQGFYAKYKESFLGGMGHIGCYSFHESKNYHCGEGGAVVINDESLLARAEILREKGTNRTEFLRGRVDKYNWVDIGSSFLLGEIPAAFLYGQLQDIEKVTGHRLSLWNRYDANLKDLQNKLTLPKVSDSLKHNGHIFFVKLKNESQRESLIKYLAGSGVSAVFHYIPLHSTEPGKKHGRFAGEDRFTTLESQRILRLPMHQHLTLEDVDTVCGLIGKFFTE